MPTSSWWLDETADQVRALLPGLTFELLDEIDSTNSELMRRARAGQRATTLLVARKQTAGRGRMGRRWQSAQAPSEAATLTFSLGLPLVPVSWSGLSLVVGVSVAESLDPDKTVPLTLKWPNDLWVWGRKLGGILVETALLQGDASERYVVIGIGLNLEPRDGFGGRNEPASLSEWRADATASTVLNELIVPLATAVRQFESEGFAPFGPRFEARDALRGQQVELSDGRRGRCEGVGSEGALLVRTDAGLSSITSAEVSVRPASGSFA